MTDITTHEQFWHWFQTNAERLRTALYSQDLATMQATMAELRQARSVVAPELILEVSSHDQPYELIVSADGQAERVEAVKDFVAAAPVIPNWTVTAFRPRLPMGESLVIEVDDEKVEPQDIWFRVAADEDGLALTLYVSGLTLANDQKRKLGAALLAEHAIGERMALTLLRSLQISPLPDDPAAVGLQPFRELVDVMDATTAQKFPPPGSLRLDLDNSWQGMEGSINGSFALVLFQLGLLPMLGHPAYDRRLHVSIPFHQYLPNGMPATEEEYTVVQELSDAITKLLQEGQESLLAMTVVTRGRRDLVFYTTNAEAALQRLQPVREAETGHTIVPQVERDTFWGMYRSFRHAQQQRAQPGH